MSDSEQEPQSAQDQELEKKFEPIFEDRTIVDILKENLGKVFLVANPESFEEGGLGPEIRAGNYRARLIGLGRDYLILLTEFVRGTTKKGSKEMVRQYIPLVRIKRISVLRTQRLLHI